MSTIEYRGIQIYRRGDQMLMNDWDGRQMNTIEYKGVQIYMKGNRYYIHYEHLMVNFETIEEAKLDIDAHYGEAK